MGVGGSGFYAQVALVIGPGEARVPLGIAGVQTKAYPTSEEREARREKQRRQLRKTGVFPKEVVFWKGSEKWGAIPLQLRDEMKGVRAIHVMDREADNYELLALLQKHRLRFVIRGDAARRVRGEEGSRVSDRLAQSDFVLKRRVRLAARPKPKAPHPLREEREATLSLRAARVTLRPTAKLRPAQLTLNVVEVVELRPPADEEPIDWVLLTSEPIDTVEDVAAVVDHYRARWRIEEYFKALKTGCSIEKRQQTSFEALKRVLALYMPIAWHLLALRSLAHAAPTAPASSFFDVVQLTVLRALLLARRQQLDAEPSLGDALLAVAALGGHLKRNGAPGWMTLGRGYDELQSATMVWRLATSPPSM